MSGEIYETLSTDNVVCTRCEEGFYSLAARSEVSLNNRINIFTGSITLKLYRYANRVQTTPTVLEATFLI